MPENKKSISLTEEEYTSIESIISKIASDNKITNVNKISLTLTEGGGMLRFDAGVQENDDGCEN